MAKNNSDYIAPVAIVVVLFALYFFVSNTEVTMTANVFENGKNVHQDEFKIATSTSYTQSIFSLDGHESFLLQSTKPVTEEDTMTVLRVKVDNPLMANAQLQKVTATANGGKLFEKVIDMPVNAGSYYTFTSDPIDLEGNDAQLNKIRLDFLFISGTQQKIITYEYAYYSLTKCTKNSDCSQPNIVCDIGNLARFSTSKDEFFCTRPCDANGDCYPGQVCIKGMCGY